MPSRARAPRAAAVDGPAGDELRGEVEGESLRHLVVAADERVLVRRRVGEVGRGEGVPAATGASSSSWIRRAIEVASAVGFTAARAERELGADREDRRRADRLAQLGGRFDRGVGLDREEDEVGAANRVVVPRSFGAERLGGGASAFGSREPITTSTPASTSRFGDRLAEAAGSTHDRNSHAAARSTVSASRRDAARSVISVLVAIRRTASPPAGSDSSTTSASISPA